MPCLHLEGVPDDLHDTLQQLARRQHDSVSQVAIAILRRALLNPRKRQGVLFPAPPRAPRVREAPADATLPAEPAE